MSGYVSDLAPVKILKHLKRKHFNFIITDNEISHWGVQFSLEKHKLFTSTEEQQTSNRDIKLNKCNMNENENIVGNNFKSANKAELHL